MSNSFSAHFLQITKRDFWVLWMDFLSTDVFEAEEMRMEEHPLQNDELHNAILSADSSSSDNQHKIETDDPDADETSSEIELKSKKISIVSTCLEMCRARFSKARRLSPFFFEDDIVVIIPLDFTTKLSFSRLLSFVDY